MSYTADFETTVDPEDCRVWAWAITEIGNVSNFKYGNSLEEFMSLIETMPNDTYYFHNLRFDGEFILYYLLKNGYEYVKNKKNLYTKSFSCLISDKNVFYTLEICFYRKGDIIKKVTIYDSLKILPFSVKEIAQAFRLPMQKLEIDYKAKREIGHKLTIEEIEYIKGDVTIVALALETIFNQGLTKMTQGSNALSDFKKITGKKSFSRYFPIPKYDADVRQSYKGGFTYLNPKFKNKVLGEGIVLDVNSLYPSVMYYNDMPYGEGVFFEGEYKKDEKYNLYVQMFSCQFELKAGRIPTVQLKNNLRFVPTEYLTSSNGEYITMCMTCVDLKLFLEQYDVYDITYHSGWKFKSTNTLFREYIDKWMKVKIESTVNGNYPMRTLAKLMLNSLYGKFALNPNVQGKIPYLKDDIVKYKLGEKETRDPIYIPVGTFITAWARNKTIRSAQQVYERFIYADTDSLHLLGTELPDNLEISPTELGAWKHESTFTKAKYLRQKSYIEEINGELHITCAGMPQSCYQYVTFDNFKYGNSFEGKLKMTHQKGGIVLMESPHTLKE